MGGSMWYSFMFRVSLFVFLLILLNIDDLLVQFSYVNDFQFR